MVGNSLYLRVRVFNVGFKVFGRASRSAFMQVTTRFTSSQSHNSGQLADVGTPNEMMRKMRVKK